MRIQDLMLLFPASLLLASCNSGYSGETSTRSAGEAEDDAANPPFEATRVETFSEPWAMAFEPGTGRLFVTEKQGALKFLDPGGHVGNVRGVPKVAYGGQGGFADIAFSPDYTTSRELYLSWAAPDEGGARRGVVGRGKLVCSEDDCALHGLAPIWRQSLAIDSPGQFALRLVFSPNGKYLFVSSGDRMKGETAQDTANNLGSIVRLNLDGTPAEGNPLAGKPGGAPDMWSWGHRNPLGLKFDAEGRLWDLEHGPAGDDELNLVERGKNYGWPLVSDGDNYDGSPIPRSSTRPDLAAPAISWNPVIAPGDFIFYSGPLFPRWRGDALIAGLRTQALIRVSFDGVKPTEAARYDMGMRVREIAQGPDGAIWVLGDGSDGQLLKLTPKN